MGKTGCLHLSHEMRAEARLAVGVQHAQRQHVQQLLATCAAGRESLAQLYAHQLPLRVVALLPRLLHSGGTERPVASGVSG